MLSVYRGASLAATPYESATGESNASGDESHAGFTPSRGDCLIALSNYNATNDLAVSTQACTDPGTLPERGEKLSMGGGD